MVWCVLGFGKFNFNLSMFETLNWFKDSLFVAFITYLPAAIANMFPVIVPKGGMLKPLFFPVDFGRQLGGQRVFGEHKTFGGILAGIVGGVISAYLVFSLILGYFVWDLSIWYGVLSGAGALLGDLLKSFVKRRLKIKDGGVLPFFDQLDFILGATFFLVLGGFEISWEAFWLTIIFTPILHLGVNILAYKLGLKKVWW